MRSLGKTLAALAPLVLAACQAGGVSSAGVTRELALSAGDRVLVLAPHPDDEVLGGGGVLRDAAARGLPVHVVFLTCGEANRWAFAVYGRALRLTPERALQLAMVRRAEALAADAALGVPPANISFLGYPDQGTLAMWTSHWGDGQAYRSPWTHATGVPYPAAYRPGAPYTGESVVADLTAILREVRPTKILVSHPADLHPDHQALYLFTRVALWGLRDEMKPELDPFLVHHPDWPQPAEYGPALPLTPPPALAKEIAWARYPLAPEAVTAKLAALKLHRTQYASDGFFLRRFARTNELFGDFPDVLLAPGKTAVLLGSEDGMLPAAVPEELTGLERELFAAATGLTVRRAGRDLVMTVGRARPLREIALSLSVFGARPDRPFSTLPKLRVELDAGRPPAGGVTVTRESRAIEVRMPLAVLGDPDRLLVSLGSSLGRVPIAASPWRIVILR